MARPTTDATATNTNPLDGGAGTDEDTPEVVTDGGEDETPAAAAETVEGHRTDGNSYSAAEEGEPATATLTAYAGRDEFYDDGRQIITVDGALDTGEQLVANSANRGQFAIDPDPKAIEAFGVDLDAERFVVADEAVIDALREHAEATLDKSRDRIIDDLGASVEAGESHKQGSGEGSEIRATGMVTTDDGRSLGVVWRNIHDFGHTTTLDDGDRKPFDDAEIDALAHLAREKSPITRWVRM